MVETSLRKRILRAFVGRGLLESFEAKEMLGYRHSGFSVDAGVCIEANDRAALERLLRYCARPPFAMERLRKAGSELVYRYAKPYSEPGNDKRGARVDELILTPLALIDHIAALVLPPRTHQHRYFGVLAPNSPLRAAVTALAVPAQLVTAQTAPSTTGECARGVLIARIYEVFPLLWDENGAQEAGEGLPDWEMANQSPPDYPEDQRTTW